MGVSKDLSGGIQRFDDLHKIDDVGKPNSRADLYKNGKLFQSRWYGPDGKPIRNRDFTDHGNAKEHPNVPHDHLWDWSKTPPRQDEVKTDWIWYKRETK